MSTGLADRFAGLALLALAGVFWWQSRAITVYPDDPGLGPLFLPRTLLIVLAGSGLLLLLRPQQGPAPGPAEEAEGRTDAAGLHAFLRWVLPLAALMIVYVIAFDSLRYLLPTAIVAIVVHAMFGNRGAFGLLVLPLLIAFTFYLAFFEGLQLYQPPGLASLPF